MYMSYTDGCKTNVTGECFWTAMIEPVGTDVSRANESCALYSSVIAVIPDQKTYDEITKNMRKKLTKEWPNISCWLGMTYNVTVSLTKLDIMRVIQFNNM